MSRRGEGGPFQRLGVRGRLLLAFFGISAFAVLAAAAAMYSFFAVGKVLDRIAQQRVPSALASLELSRQAERIVAAAPALLAAQTPDQHDQRSRIISVEVERLGALLSELRGSTVGDAALEGLEAAITRLRANLEGLDSLVADNLALGEQKKQIVQGVLATNDATQQLLAPWVLITESRISQLRGLADDPTLASDERISGLVDLVGASRARERLQQAQLEASFINDTLLQAATVERPDRLSVMEFRLRRRIGTLDSLSSEFDPKLRTLLSAQTQAFRGLTEGADSLPVLRRKELELVRAGQNLLQENDELARRLTAAVDRLVQAAKSDIAAANLEARSVQRFSSGVLIAVVVLSLVSSTLIVWLYVGRNLIARLTALSDSMLAIAGGNLRTKLPTIGGDEIGRMAEALTVFRDTAVEVEEKNLREIAKARQRLIDAIESISEGFSFYDKGDRLALSNRRYRELLYPGIEDAVKPGTQFATIIRNAAERGLVRDAEGRIEEWIAERMERHCDPGDTFVQRRSDGRWIEVTEHKISEGGTVAIYTDITEQKQSEIALLEEKRRTEEASKLVIQKNQMLESLSVKLAKYLSPQVYDSIFSGRQEVKIASTRKKLTIFFSDIAGFTETADRLESEELCQLLNHYLTEMSRIALDHGATIDKYVGDAILVFFGDPETRGVKEDALACVKMAIAMRNRMRDLADIWRQVGIEKPLEVRMGIHTGFCTVGNFGSEDRMDYTIIGGAVNTASRLETLATPGEILISYETLAHVRDQIHCEEHGEVEVKGIAYPVATYWVVDSYENLGKERRHFCEEHPNVKVDLDFDAMTTDDRSQATNILRRALDLLSSIDEPALSDRAAKNDSEREGPTSRDSKLGAEDRRAR